MANLWRVTFQQVTSTKDASSADPSADPNVVWTDCETGLAAQATATREFVRLLREQRDNRTIRQVRIVESDIPIPTFTDRTAAILQQLNTPPAPANKGT